MSSLTHTPEDLADKMDALMGRETEYPKDYLVRITEHNLKSKLPLGDICDKVFRPREETLRYELRKLAQTGMAHFGPYPHEVAEQKMLDARALLDKDFSVTLHVEE